ncbi:MAG: hypothetical protein WBA83_18545 [Burkholderiaceae bacterium]
MKTILWLILAWVGGTAAAHAQVAEAQLRPFLGGLSLVQSSGEGLTQSSGDILLELASQEPDDNETLLVLRSDKGKLRRVAENNSLLMGRGMLGISGGNYPALADGVLSVDYTIGSGSGQSDISIKFERLADGRYSFKDYTSITRNYGVENLFARNRISAAQTGAILFPDANEEIILKKSGAGSPAADAEQATTLQPPAYASRYIPQGFVVAAFAEGDLNLDAYKKDLLLVLLDEEKISIRLLMQQADGRYALARSNDALLSPDAEFNAENLRVVIKNGYFTIEQRVALDDVNFDHRYATFKYDAGRKNWFLNSFAVEHYAGFNPKPSKDVSRLGRSQFGTLWFSGMQRFPEMDHHSHGPASTGK